MPVQVQVLVVNSAWAGEEVQTEVLATEARVGSVVTKEIVDFAPTVVVAAAVLGEVKVAGLARAEMTETAPVAATVVVVVVVVVTVVVEVVEARRSGAATVCNGENVVMVLYRRNNCK